MAVNSTHPDYDANAMQWLRARDVLAGEDSVKAAGARYLPRLESQTEDEFAAYKNRASFFNATARTSDAYNGLIFRRAPFVKVPEDNADTATASGVARAMAEFVNDADMLGTSLYGYAKNAVEQVIGVGRAGTLIDWEGDFENRAYATLYFAEQIINWQVERVNGRNVPTMIALREVLANGHLASKGKAADEFVREAVQQIRVLKLVPQDGAAASGSTLLNFVYQVELWRQSEGKKKQEWVLTETRTPLRLGRPLPLIPFVFHGPHHSQATVDKLPLADLIAVNLDHYRLDADYKHGMHFTALPTAWVSGFDKGASLRIGASTAWVSWA